MKKISHIKQVALAVVFSLSGTLALGQVGPSDPSPVVNGGEYDWPQSPCPEVQIKQRHDHTAGTRYRRLGWDTVVNCANPTIILSSMPLIPVQFFNGQYYVDPIPYDPPDTTFSLGTRMPIGTDDVFASTFTSIPYPFYFFGIRKNQFRIGANGLVSFCSPETWGGSSAYEQNYCPYPVRGANNKLPWNGTSGHAIPGGASYNNRMLDAIYGIYEDTDPAYFVGSESNRVDGIYYGIQDEFPCRKIICSWKEAPDFSHHSSKGTYQIVCYEGSNIIEIHVKKRQCCPSTSDALIGIQNATGQPQVASTNPSDPNSSQSISGKPAAFFPANLGNPAGTPWTNEIYNVAYRFTPAGSTNTRARWYRIFDDGREDYELPDGQNDPAAQGDTNGYYIPMGETSTAPTLTKAIVHPTVPTKYRFHLRFKNANNDWYYLNDTITIGVDTLKYLNLHKARINDTMPAKLDICIGDTARMRVDMHKWQEINRELWYIYRITGGDTILLDTLVGNGRTALQNSYMTIGNQRLIPAFRIINGDTIVVDTTLHTIDDYNLVGDSVRVRDIQLFSVLLPTTGQQDNKIDSIYIMTSTRFTNGCPTNDTMLVRVFPKFNTTVTHGICHGDTLHWITSDNHGHRYELDYTHETDPANTFVVLQSEPGCDSTVRLRLKIFDTIRVHYPVTDCKPYTWIDSNGNGNRRTYYQTNNNTAATDTIMLKNIYGCDSIVQLDFTLRPLTAKLRSDVDHFDLDHLDAVLTDISIGGNGRVWKLPGASDQTGVNAYYTIPVELDGAEITLIESSEWGCVDSAKIYLPLNKEHFWMPNAFTPDNPAGNNTFGSVSTKTLHQEMLIYNRRGELVFSCKGTDCAWNGRDFNGNPCVQGAYVYIIRYSNEFEPNVTHTIRGTVMLIR